jgi:hypothetical protein
VKKYLLVILVITGFIFADNLVVNGDFEQPLTTGWLQATSGSNTTINRATNYDPDPDYETYVYKGSGDGYARLYQIIDVSTIDLVFSINAKFYAYDNHSSAWAASAVVISYMDESNTVLGETRIYQGSIGCPWTNSSTLHLINASDTNWNNYEFNIVDELANLPGVDSLEIDKIEVALYSFTSWC